MSVLSHTSLPYAAATVREPARGSGPAALLRALVTEWRARRAERQVEALDDAVLHDLGIARGEIPQAVRFGRRGGGASAFGARRPV